MPANVKWGGSVTKYDQIGQKWACSVLSKGFSHCSPVSPHRPISPPNSSSLSVPSDSYLFVLVDDADRRTNPPSSPYAVISKTLNHECRQQELHDAAHTPSCDPKAQTCTSIHSLILGGPRGRHRRPTQRNHCYRGYPASPNSFSCNFISHERLFCVVSTSGLFCSDKDESSCCHGSSSRIIRFLVRCTAYSRTQKEEA